jgi:hypothetical protein
MDQSQNPEPRSGYVTHARRQLDERPLLLRGGPLDGLLCAFVVSVGQRVFCGEGEWSVNGVYLVTAQTTTESGELRHVAVPAFASTLTPAG